jgi:hypothetical protein
MFPGDIGATVSGTLSDHPALEFIHNYIHWLTDFTVTSQ